MARLVAPLILLLILWGSRLAALDSLPLHNDEGLHLTRAVEVWNGNPFWQINDGKIINHWLIAAFYPQSAPDFVGRFATVLVAMAGLAAAWALARSRFGLYAALLACGLWIVSPYLFFYERLAFSDAQAGALVVVTIWASLRVARSGRARDAVLAGAALAAAGLFKFTALPFALSAALVVLLLGEFPLRRRLALVGVSALVVVLAFAGPVLLLLVRGTGLFDIALGWLGAGTGGQMPDPLDNTRRMIALLADFGGPLVLAGMVIGPLALLPRRDGRALVFAAALPLVLMLVIGRDVMPRHYVVVLPLWLTLAGAGLGRMVEQFPQRIRGTVTATALAGLMLTFIPTLMTVPNPAQAQLPSAVRAEHLTDHSAGTGLREALWELPERVAPDAPVVGSMFPDSCRRANFYARGLTLRCADAPGTELIASLLQEYGVVYVLADFAPIIGADVPALADTLSAQAERIAGYPRPGETEEHASVILWRLDSAE